MIHLEPPSYELFIIQKNVAEEIQIMFLPLIFTMKRSVFLGIIPRNHERLQRKIFHLWKVFIKNNFVAVKGPVYLWYIYIYIYIYVYIYDIYDIYTYIYIYIYIYIRYIYGLVKMLYLKDNNIVKIYSYNSGHAM